MKTKVYLLFAAIFFCLLHGYSQSYLMLDPNNNSPSHVWQDADGNISVNGGCDHNDDITAPVISAQLLNCNTNAAVRNYFAAQKTGLNANFEQVVTATDFVITGEGKVGIGTAEPQAPLHVKCKNWYDNTGDLPGTPVQLFEDPAGHVLGVFLNEGTSSSDNPGGALIVMARPEDQSPALAIFNQADNVIPFAVLGNSTVAMGVDVSPSSDFTPEAQVNISKSNTYSYLLKLQNSDQSHDYLTVHNNGYVGIGTANYGRAMLAINDAGNSGVAAHFVIEHSAYSSNPYFIVRYGTAGIGIDPGTTNSGSTLAIKASTGNNTNVDLFENSSTVANNAQLRWYGSNGTSVRHLITENNNGDLLIDAGVTSGGASDKLKVDGDEEITGYANIGFGTSSAQPVPSVLGSTLALHHVHTDDVTGPTLDFFQEDDITGWNGQIRFGRKYTDGGEQCTMRHIIADNYTTGELDIMPAVETDPDKIGSANHLTNIVHIKGRMVIGEKKITSTPHDNAQLFVDGKIVAKYVVVTESNWADHVFNRDYALRSLPELENYIAQNHHLPEVPSECEVEEKGVNVGEMNATLLKKIEELTLYVLAQQKQMDKMKEQLNVLSNH
ncbi:MAG: hypothetical protein NTY88_12000 [Bacteroidetes bacterium]|nr:hypothetical protein [Bacteroidota bacterium]